MKNKLGIPVLINSLAVKDESIDKYGIGDRFYYLRYKGSIIFGISLTKYIH